MLKLHIISFGCQMNAADSEEMTRPLLDRGFQTTGDLAQADAVLVNTCTVRQHAEDRAVSQIGRLRRWKSRAPGRLLIVAGCAAERLKASLQKRFPFVDLVSGAKSIDEYPAALEQVLKKKFNFERESGDCFPAAQPIGSTPLPFSGATQSHVTIMRGCNYNCSYCIVPAVRGREQYRSPAGILQEIREKVARGAREIMLLGQTVNSYRYPREAASFGRDALLTWRRTGEPKMSRDFVDFADLLRLIEPTQGLERIRFMSPHPHYVSDSMIAAMAECRKVCEHIHLPVQSGSDRLLQLMNRNYSRSEFLNRVAKLRSAIPDIAITTDIIVGFPQETEEDFQDTLRLVEEADFDAAYCFKFSPRDGTAAAPMQGQTAEAVKKERLKRLLELVESRALLKKARFVGREVEVLMEDVRFGKTRNFFPVKFEQAQTPGRLARGVIGALENAALVVKS